MAKKPKTCEGCKSWNECLKYYMRLFRAYTLSIMGFPVDIPSDYDIPCIRNSNG